MGINPRKVEMDLEIGERIQINEGAFAGMEGNVTALETEKGKIKASIEMFGRETSAELDYGQVSKID